MDWSLLSLFRRIRSAWLFLLGLNRTFFCANENGVVFLLNGTHNRRLGPTRHLRSYWIFLYSNKYFPNAIKKKKEKKRRHEINGLCWPCRPRSEIHTHLSGNGLLWKKTGRSNSLSAPLPGGATSVPNGWMERERERSIYTMDWVIYYILQISLKRKEKD